MKNYLLTLCIVIAGLVSFSAYAGVHKDHDYHYVLQPVPEGGPAHMRYFFKLADLALNKTKSEYGEFSIAYAEGFYASTRRYVRALKQQDRLNLLWTMTTKEYEKDLRAIRVPLVKGMNGYRVFLIKKGKQKKFNKIRNIEQLKLVTGGIGAHWPDMDIMVKNNLSLITSTEYDTLIKMLIRGRYDYFPRGVYEVFAEDRVFPELEIEKRLAISYFAPIYFFMPRENEKLAERLEKGIRIAIKDGSFDELFFSTPGFTEGYNEMTRSNRRVFHLSAVN